MALPRGIAFPFQAGENEFPLADTDITLIEDSIKQILLTEVGERLMRPLFGSRLRTFLFENIDEITQVAIKTEVLRSISQGDPRILIVDISVVSQGIDDANRNAPGFVVSIVFDFLGRRSQVNVPIGQSLGLNATLNLTQLGG